MSSPTEDPAWHQALAYAVTGRHYPELGRQDRPDVSLVAAFLRDRSAADPPALGPLHPLPPELAEGLGPAQLWAAASALRALLATNLDAGPAVPVLTDRPLSADEQRLLRDVPPHHGS